MRGAFFDDVAREEHAVERSLVHALAHRVGVDRAAETEQAADADQREPESELNWRELGRDDDDESEAAMAVGEDRVQQADAP